MKKDLTYKEAASRLDEIVRRIESESPDVDELTGLVKEAVSCLSACVSFSRQCFESSTAS